MPDLNWWNLMSRHWGKLLGGLLGLIFALLVLKYGWWGALFIIACTAVGIFAGWRIDVFGGLRNLIERFFSSRESY
jgi:uncharacterized membrane protein